MSQTWDGSGPSRHKAHKGETSDQNKATVSALNYALVQMELDEESYNGLNAHEWHNSVCRTVALALYLNELGNGELGYVQMAQKLRQHDLYMRHEKINDDDYHMIAEHLEKLKTNAIESVQKQVLLTKNQEGLAWNVDDIPATPQEFMQAIYRDDKTYTADKYFGYVVDEYRALNERNYDKYDSTEFNHLAQEAVENVLQGNLEKQRGLHYFALMAYTAREKTVAIDADLQAVKNHLQQSQQAAEQKQLAAKKSDTMAGCTAYVLLAGVVAGVGFVVHRLDQIEKNSELEQEAKEIVVPVTKQDEVANDTIQIAAPKADSLVIGK